MPAVANCKVRLQVIAAKLKRRPLRWDPKAPAQLVELGQACMSDLGTTRPSLTAIQVALAAMLPGGVAAISAAAKRGQADHGPVRPPKNGPTIIRHRSHDGGRRRPLSRP